MTGATTSIPSKPTSRRKLSRRTFLRLGVRGGISAGVLGLTSLAEARTVEPKWIQISRHDVTLPHLPRAFDGFTIAHITDLHADDPSCSYDLKQVCELTSAQNADAIVMTGDFSSGPGPGTEEKLIPALSLLKARAGVFGVTGNHDYWAEGPERVRYALKESGVSELFNDVHELKRDGESLYICGVDDPWQGNPDIERVASLVPKGKAAVVMVHEPDYAPELASHGKFGLMLSGHSHGGQVALPFVGPIILPDKCTHYPRGRYEVNGMTLYTNRGIGTVGLPLRFCARPELAIFTLKCASAQAA